VSGLWEGHGSPKLDQFAQVVFMDAESSSA
jgi:hypothetical protein